MLYTIAVILLALWLLGLVSSYTMGGFIHILLVVAVIVIIMQLISWPESSVIFTKLKSFQKEQKCQNIFIIIKHLG